VFARTKKRARGEKGGGKRGEAKNGGANQGEKGEKKEGADRTRTQKGYLPYIGHWALKKKKDRSKKRGKLKDQWGGKTKEDEGQKKKEKTNWLHQKMLFYQIRNLK